MLIGVKYCGGCNPRYDRKKFLQRLEKEFVHEYEIAKEEKIYDILLVLCGCSSCCAKHAQFKFKYEKIIVADSDNYIKVGQVFNKHSDI